MDRVTIIKILVAVLLACLLPYLFYKMGAGVGLGHANLTIGTSFPFNQSKSRLRSNQSPPLNHTHTTTNDKVPSSSCARDVFLTLHKVVGGEGEGSCKGLLISDDILVTSRACSEFEFTFDFPGFGLARAVPHALLNSRVGKVNLRLGFLEATPPYHYHFLGKPPTRRTPMFLSYRSAPAAADKGGKVGTPVVVDCVDRHIPVARNFPVDGEMVPLGELAGVVPDDILWEEIDIYTAIVLKYKKHRWWAKPATLEDEMDAIWEMFDEYRGPPGSVSIPAAHKSFVNRAAGLFEVVDPRGHRGQNCFKNYFSRYLGERPFSGMHFFDWLDFGHGRFILEKNEGERIFPPMKGDENCLKREFNEKRVHYFSDKERREHEIYIEPSRDGGQLIARYRHNDEPVPESHPEHPHLYMWDLNGTFYVVDNSWNRERYGRIKHTAVMAGQPALSGGKAYFDRHGVILGINYSSGHYRPGIGAAALMHRWMKNRGFNTTALHWIGRKSWSRATCRETDWDAFRISGYDNDELRLACYEVSSSPTWMTKEDV